MQLVHPPHLQHEAPLILKRVLNQEEKESIALSQDQATTFSPTKVVAVKCDDEVEAY